MLARSVKAVEFFFALSFICFRNVAGSFQSVPPDSWIIPRDCAINRPRWNEGGEITQDVGGMREKLVQWEAVHNYVKENDNFGQGLD